METNNIERNDVNKANPKGKIRHWGVGWSLLLIFLVTAFFGFFIYLFFVLYFIDTTYSFFLVLAVIGIILYTWSLYNIFRDRSQPGPVIRFKGKEYSFWSIVLVASFCFLIGYFLLCGATILYDRIVHDDHSMRVFSVVCSSKLFWWILSVGLVIHILAWVEKGAEVKQAIANKHESNENLKDNL